MQAPGGYMWSASYEGGYQIVPSESRPYVAAGFIAGALVSIGHQIIHQLPAKQLAECQLTLLKLPAKDMAEKLNGCAQL